MLKLRPWQSSCARIRSAPRSPLSSPSTGAPRQCGCRAGPVSCPSWASALVVARCAHAQHRRRRAASAAPAHSPESVSESPRDRSLSAGAERATQQRAACITARRPRIWWICQACSRPALLTALRSLTTLLAMACLQVGTRYLAALQCRRVANCCKPPSHCWCFAAAVYVYSARELRSFYRAVVLSRCSGSAGSSAANAEHAVPAVAAPAAAAPRRASKRRAAPRNAFWDAYDGGAASKGMPGKRRKAAAVGASTEAEGRCAGEAHVGRGEGQQQGSCAALRPQSAIRDPHFAAALAHECTQYAKQVRSM